MNLYIFLISICIGSFMNVLIYRLPKNENFIIDRSYCPNCHHVLNVFDLIPILSYLLLKGKCRYCQSKISSTYFIIELLSGFIGLYFYNQFGFQLNWFIYFIIIELCIVISIIDMKIMIIHDELNFVIFILGLIRIFYYHLNLIEYVLYSLWIPIIFFMMNILYKDSIGGGDIKFMFSIGYLLGKDIFISYFIGIFCASIYALYLLFYKKVDSKSKFALGPFLVIGVIFTIIK